MLDIILNLDRKFFLMINNGWANHFNDILFAALTLLGSTYIILPITAIIIYTVDKKKIAEKFTLILLSILIGGLFIHILKELVDRPRPLNDMRDLIREGKVHINVIFQPLKEGSFPSGHSQTVFTVATILSYAYRKYIFALFFIASLSAISRIYVGAHYPLDVLTGGIIGVLVSISVLSIFNKYTFQRLKDLFNKYNA